MRAIVGIDEAGAYKPVVKLLGQLHFASPSVMLLHAADTALKLPGNAEVTQAAKEQYARLVQNLGLTALDEARDLACGWDLHARTKFVFGQAAGSLTSEAETANADLVAVCASHQGTWSTNYLGSVSRALAIYCRSSVLISKGDIPIKKPLRAVFATDHSPYAEGALDRFLNLNCRGIDEVHVVSASELDDSEAQAYRLNLPMLGGDIDRYMEEVVESCNAVCREKLELAGYQTSSIVTEGNANDVIRQAMNSTQSDLLILGAQGAGALGDILIGSVALHQVVAEPYPVLILRI